MVTPTRPRRNPGWTVPAPPAQPEDILVAHWTESELQRFVRNTARGLGWRCYHTRFSVGSDAGYPDLALCKPPRFILAELKTMTGTMTRARLTRADWPRWVNGQAEWLSDLLRCPGVEAYLWRPSHTQDISAILADGPSPEMRCVRELAAQLEAA